MQQLTEYTRPWGATENAGVENEGALKMQGVENAGVEIAAP